MLNDLERFLTLSSLAVFFGSILLAYTRHKMGDNDNSPYVVFSYVLMNLSAILFGWLASINGLRFN